MTEGRVGYSNFAEWASWHIQPKKRIAIIATGGTIASIKDPIKGAHPVMSGEEILEITPRVRELNQVDRIDIFNLLDRDSSDLNPKLWKQMAEKAHELLPFYHGILVFHGTDTLVNTANAVSLSIRGRTIVDHWQSGNPDNKLRPNNWLPTPIVFISSQKGPKEVQTDAVVNIEDALVTVIRASDEAVSEVIAVSGHENILRAPRCVKDTEVGFDIFGSPKFERIGSITAVDTSFNRYADRIRGIDEILRQPTALPFQPNFEKGIMSVLLNLTNTTKQMLRLIEDEETTGLILHSPGAGNVPFSDPDFSMIPAIEKGVVLGKPVVIATQIRGGEVRPDIYEAGKVAVEAGAIPAKDMTPYTTAVKLSWLLAQDDCKSYEFISRYFAEDIAGEVGQVE